MKDENEIYDDMNYYLQTQYLLQNTPPETTGDVIFKLYNKDIIRGIIIELQWILGIIKEEKE